MRNKAILVSIIALFAMILTLNAVSATNFVRIDKIYVNGVDTGDQNNTNTIYVGQVSDTVPIEVQFTALDSVNDTVKIKASILDFRKDIEQTVELETGLVNGTSGYPGKLSLKFPSSMDLKNNEDLNQVVTLYIRIYAGDKSFETTRKIRMQRDLFSLNILSIDGTDKAIAGSTLDFTIVVQNNGNERLDNVYVKASIPELSIERRVYYGDLDADQDDTYDEIRDATERKIYLTLPGNAVPGTYNVEFEAYNYDVSTTAKKKIEVSGLQSGVLPTTSSKTIAIGEETSFDLVVVNPNDRMIVYTITPEESKGLSITVEQPVLTVAAQSSATVKVKVKATSSAQEGTYLVTVNVNSDTGLVKQVSYSLNVEKATSGSTVPGSGTIAANGVLILTVVLVIIFVVLLIVLIVLLTRKPAETEEFGETSYY